MDTLATIPSPTFDLEHSSLEDLEDLKENLQDEFIKEALESGMDLREFSQKIERQLADVENNSIEDYIKESQNIAALHGQISCCDDILKNMEQMLRTFQADLGSISHEILSLQHQSVAMNIRLKNRQAIRGELSQFIDDIVVPESMIKHILETPVTEKEFLESLQMLDHKICFVRDQAFQEARACRDVQDVLDKLRIKALAKVREYLLQRVFSFRKPMTNYQIPQNAMLKNKFFYKFLAMHSPEVAMEVCSEYVGTLSRIYYSYFKSYVSRLMKLQFEVVADKDDLMGHEDTAKRSIFSGKPSLRNRSTVFTLGDRAAVLTTDLEAPILVPHAAARTDVKYTFESLFRSMQFALMDNACREYLFITEFFVGSNPMDIFGNVMGRTLNMFQKHVETYVQDCFDSIALFLSIHLILRYQHMMQKRGIPALERYWESLLAVLWPRFEHVLQLNIQSIHDCDPQRLGSIDLRPHYITRRYAEFSAAIHEINSTQPSERVVRGLAALHAEVENCVLRMAAEFPGRKEQLVFLLNNYDMMLGVLQERTKGAEDSREAESLKELLSARTQEYVEEALAPHFGGLITFVRDGEKMVERGQMEQLRREDKKVAPIIRGFNSSWKKSIEDINQEILRSFSNFKNGTNILQVGLTQLIQYYHRFQKLLSQPPLKSNPARTELLNIHHLMVEAKKYKTSF
ncbi:VPS52 [Cordylochernes scorpioides]|uniref:Vacuolar protein sorting-associated protein 52 homolog n=1 Tax=Cordylochernes scorpioides TaxID=51811 RepID=A0ABY6KRV3_9ARAC|nr:VPS52 [Cordylochernes scorpioides]